MGVARVMSHAFALAMSEHSEYAEEYAPEDPWGLLVSLDKDFEERFPIIGKEFKIGRNKDCDVVILNNKHVSSCHCSIIRDEEGIVWCKDTSTNGTLVNGVKISHKQVKLDDSQVINIAFRKDNPNQNISYKFVSLSSVQEMTQEHVNTLEEDKNSLTEKVTETVTPNEEEKEKPKKPELNKKDSIEETLICEICQEILHDCVSLQPCTHTYCAGCYSEWMEYSRECPACRLTVERITKNFIVNNLVSAYLRSHPEKRRPEEDLKELDEKNKITKDMIFPKTKKRRRLSSDEDDSEDDEDDEDDEDTTSSAFIASPLKGYSAAPFSHFVPPVRCRQCPGYISISSTSTPSSTFTCTPTTNHVICLCCLLPMPDRRSDSDLSVPPQKCDICSKAFCHMYWGCQKLGCRGCLNLFKDIDYDDSILGNIICNNSYESRILKDYLRDKDLAFKDMIITCLDKLDNGTYTAPDTRTARISSSTRTCYSCAVKNMKELAFQYRGDISNDDLPDRVTGRPNCHWGRNCRTQVHNRIHAENYNHICPQTKF